MRGTAFACVALSAVALGFLVHLRHADAQRLDPRRPASFVVGSPSGASPTIRGDARRTGASRLLLPEGVLHIAWRKALGVGIEHAALAGPDGMVAVVTSRGEAIFVDADGAESARIASGVASAGPATMIADGTVVFVSSAGDAVGIRRSNSVPRFVTRIGAGGNARAAPLSLEDGGVVVATSSQLVALDAAGNVRVRTALPEAPSAPLLASAGKVVAVTSEGTIYGWTPGREAVRLGSFGAAIDGAAALVGAKVLVAIAGGNQLVEVDLTSGVRSSRSVATQGLYLGPPSIRDVAASAPVTTFLEQTQSRFFVVTFGAGGQELARAPVATLVPKALPDGGLAPLVAAPHTGTLVDSRGAVVFATPDGHVGRVGPDGSVDTLQELVCAEPSRPAGLVGLTPLEGGAFAVTCEGGVVIKITGSN